jgi:hypothetical protein
VSSCPPRVGLMGLPPAPAVTGASSVVAPVGRIFDADEQPWVVPQPGPVGCDVCLLHAGSNSVIGGTLSSGLTANNSKVQVRVQSGSWNTATMVTTSTFSISTGLAATTSNTAAAKMSAFVGYWISLSEGAVPVVSP